MSKLKELRKELRARWKAAVAWLRQNSMIWQVIEGRLDDAWLEIVGLIGDLRSVPRGLPSSCTYEAGGPRNMTVVMPLDIPTLNLVRDLFRANGWEVGDYELKYRSWYETQARRGRRWVTLRGVSYKEGSTCKIQQVGTITREEQVFEVVCPDAEPIEALINA
jgi:hypothetical protein